MYFQHHEEIWHRFPKLVPGALVLEGIREAVQAEEFLQLWYRRTRERLKHGSETQMPEIQAWRRAYGRMGLKPTQYRSAAEALLRRFKREKTLPRLHPLVDLGNAASMAYALPVAVFDLDSITDYLEVRPAKGSEEYLAFNGELERPDAGEVIFVDGADRVHSRRWTYRQSSTSTIRSNSSRALVVSEGMHDGALEDVQALIASLAEAAASLWKAPRVQAVLSAASPRIDFP